MFNLWLILAMPIVYLAGRSLVQFLELAVGPGEPVRNALYFATSDSRPRLPMWLALLLAKHRNATVETARSNAIRSIGLGAITIATLAVCLPLFGDIAAVSFSSSLLAAVFFTEIGLYAAYDLRRGESRWLPKPTGLVLVAFAVFLSVATILDS